MSLEKCACSLTFCLTTLLFFCIKVESYMTCTGIYPPGGEGFTHAPSFLPLTQGFSVLAGKVSPVVPPAALPSSGRKAAGAAASRAARYHTHTQPLCITHTHISKCVTKT